MVSTIPARFSLRISILVADGGFCRFRAVFGSFADLFTVQHEEDSQEAPRDQAFARFLQNVTCFFYCHELSYSCSSGDYRKYPGHLKPLDGLLGFVATESYYNGVILFTGLEMIILIHLLLIGPRHYFDFL